MTDVEPLPLQTAHQIAWKAADILAAGGSILDALVPFQEVGAKSRWQARLAIL